LGGDVRHTFLIAGQLTFAASVFCTGTTGQRNLQNGGIFSRGETERGRAHQGKCRDIEEVGCMQKTRIGTDNKPRMCYQIAGLQQRSLTRQIPDSFRRSIFYFFTETIRRTRQQDEIILRQQLDEHLPVLHRPAFLDPVGGRDKSNGPGSNGPGKR